jgi:hypothetical protein
VQNIDTQAYNENYNTAVSAKFDILVEFGWMSDGDVNETSDTQINIILYTSGSKTVL